MKRILNLNNYGVISLLVIVLFLIVLPAVFYTASLLLGPANSISAVLLTLVKASAMVGTFLLAVFTILLALEQVQDRIIFRQYLKNRSKRRPIADGLYECQFCGCRTVREFDAVCLACGKSLDQEIKEPHPVKN